MQQTHLKMITAGCLGMMTRSGPKCNWTYLHKPCPHILRGTVTGNKEDELRLKMLLKEEVKD